MKSILSFVFVILCSLCCFGQGRSCDIRANILQPNPGHTFVSISKQVVKVSLINEGPDTLRHGDDYSVKFRFGGVHIFPTFNSINRYVYPGDSIVYTDTLDINYVGDLDSMPFCTEVLFCNGGRDSIQRETPEQKINNTHCITTKHKRTNVSIGNRLTTPSPITIFPNPTTGIVNIESSKGIQSIVIADQKGSIVMRHEPADKLTVQLDVSGLIQGMYFISIKSEDHVFTEKLISM